MTLLEWRDAFRIGIAEVDHEHQQLIALINAIHDAASSGGPAAVVQFLGELHARISAHFALEEKVMRGRGYGGYAAHKHEHEQLLGEIRDIMDQYELEHRFDARSLGASLERWFSAHFRTRDAELHRSLDIRT